MLSSGSVGNCYLLSNDNETLILDAGIPIGEIKKGLNFNLKSVVGVLCSHEHKDHILSAKKLHNMGFTVWQPYLNSEVKISKKNFGNFKVSCFDVPHDGVENRGFLIESNGEKLLYATDFEYIPYNFRKQKINYLLIECNYIADMVDDDSVNRTHVIRGHSELSTVIDIVNVNKSDSLQAVILCHLSAVNSDSERIINEMQKVANCPIYVAKKGMAAELER